MTNFLNSNITLAGLLSVALGAVSFLFWRMIDGMQKKIDLMLDFLINEKGNLVTKEDCEAWRDRCSLPSLWRAFNSHTHAPSGEVIRRD